MFDLQLLVNMTPANLKDSHAREIIRIIFIRMEWRAFIENLQLGPILQSENEILQCLTINRKRRKYFIARIIE